MSSHYLKQIAEDHHSLSAEARAHIKDCAECRTELKMMLRIEQGVSSIPEVPVPTTLRQRVMRKIFQPAYQTWQLVAAAVAVLLSPILLQHTMTQVRGALPRDMMIGVFVAYGLLICLVAVPVSFRLFQSFEDDMHDMEHRVDHFLEHFSAQDSLRTLGGRIRKRVGF